MLIETEGTIKEILAQFEQKEGKTFIRQDAVIETNEKYPTTMRLEFYNEKAETLRNCNVGDVIKFKFYIRGNKGAGGKLYNNLIIHSIERT